MVALRIQEEHVANYAVNIVKFPTHFLKICNFIENVFKIMSK